MHMIMNNLDPRVAQVFFISSLSIVPQFIIGKLIFSLNSSLNVYLYKPIKGDERLVGELIV